MARRKRALSDSSSSSGSSCECKRQAGHREGYYPALAEAYPFLVPVEDRDNEGKVIGVLCSLCMKHETDQRNHAGTWTSKPCSCIRKDVIDRHSKSAMHREAIEKETLRKQSSRDGGIARAFERQITAQRKAVVGAMKVMYWLAKEEVAHTTKYESLLDLAISLGCTYLKELNVADNANYRSRQIVGDVTTSFLAIADLPDGTAQSIEAAMMQITEQKSIDVSRLRGFGSDGAPVMTGNRSGVAKRLKDRFPKLISIHCVNHRLALAAAHAADGIPYLVRFKATVQTLFLFYQNSPVRMAGLHTIQEVLNDPVIKLKQAKDVRWLSHEAAISSILRTMPSLIASLEREASERKEPAAVGLVKFVKTYYFVACCKLLSKILPHINRLSLLFQREDVDLSAIRPNLNATIHAIELYRESDVEAEQLIERELSEFGIDLSPARKGEFKENVQKKYVDSVIAQLELRFPHILQVASFCLFDPSRFPDDRTKISSYGNEELEVLCELYGKGDNPDVNVDALKVEWEGFKFLMCDTYRQNSMKAVLKILVADRTVSHLYPQLRKLAAIALVLPVSTAECERAFSTMNRIKTDLRNRLITLNLDHLMRISINGPSQADYDFDKAATLWGNQRQRRIKL